jgi:hypothetical protein
VPGPHHQQANGRLMCATVARALRTRFELTYEAQLVGGRFITLLEGTAEWCQNQNNAAPCLRQLIRSNSVRLTACTPVAACVATMSTSNP